MLSFKQGGIKYHFWVFGMDWTPIFRTIGDDRTKFKENTCKKKKKKKKTTQKHKYKRVMNVILWLLALINQSLIDISLLIVTI